MKRTEMLRESTNAIHADRISKLLEETQVLIEQQKQAAENLGETRKQHIILTEDIAATLLPSAQAMAQLIEETKQVVSQLKEASLRIKATTDYCEMRTRRMVTDIETNMPKLPEILSSVQRNSLIAVVLSGLAAFLSAVSASFVIYLAWRAGFLK